MVVDPDVLWLWRHDAPPDYPPGVDLDDELVAQLNDAVDLRIDGADAVEAGERLGREWHPLYLYDVPRARVGEFRAEIDRLTADERLDAHVVELDARVPHLARAAQALEIGGGAGIVSFRHEAVAVGGVASRVAVRGERDEVVADVADGEVAATLEVGPAPVEEEGRLALVDLDALADPLRAELIAFAVGEGLYPVYRDLDADGRLVRVRIALAQ